MLNKNATINIAYHFLAEGMIIFLLAIPFTYGEYHQLPYWSYLGIVSVMCVAYSVYTANEKRYGWYIATAPAFIALFYVFNFPLYLSVGFSLLLLYRYIILRKETILNKETTYFNVIVILSMALLIFWLRDIELIIYPFLLLSLLLSGNILSHLQALKKEEQQDIKQQLWMTFGSVIVMGAISVIFIFSIRDVFNRIWYGLMSIPGYIAGKFGDLIHTFFPEPTIFEGFTWEKLFGTGELGKNFKKRLPEDKNTADIMDYAHMIYWIIGILIIVVITTLSIRYFRNRFNPIVATEHQVLTENEA
ncbi:MAG TPA: hypothetical protein VK142_07605, partial [Bacillota bacterium]|nr:hypothetical protein [Bacillota bacterium]